MSEWAVLHLDRNPAPGDPGQVRSLATRLLHDADLADRNTRLLRTISAGDGALRMDGDYAPKFRQVLGELPDELDKLGRAYRGAGEALTAYAGSLEDAQTRAGAALRQGNDAAGAHQGAVRQVQALLPPDRVLYGAQTLDAAGLNAVTADLDEGLRAQIQAAAARGRAAEADRARARRLAAEAAEIRGDAAERCANGIRSALGDIKNKEWYEKTWSTLTKPFRSWDDFVGLCRTVALVAGLAALVVSGPLGLAMIAIAAAAGAVVFTDTVNRYRRGEAGLTDVAWDTLGLFPGGRGGQGVSGVLRSLARGDGKRVGGALPRPGADSAFMGTRRRWAGQDIQPVPPRRPPDSTLANGDPVYHGPNSTAVGYDDATLRNFARVEPLAGHHDVIVHSDGNGLFAPGAIGGHGRDIRSMDVHPSHVVDAILANPNYDGGPIRLISCYSALADAPDAGTKAAAQAVADALGVPVMAPTSAVGAIGDGAYQRVPTFLEDGMWLIFHPSGSRP